MLNVKLFEKRGEDGEHSRTLGLGLGLGLGLRSEGTALAFPKEWTPSRGVAA